MIEAATCRLGLLFLELAKKTYTIIERTKSLSSFVSFLKNLEIWSR